MSACDTLIIENYQSFGGEVLGTKRKLKVTTNPQDILVTTAFDEFIEEKQSKNLSPATIRNYRQSVGFFLEFVKEEIEEDADYTCGMVDVKQIFKWSKDCLDSGNTHDTVNHYLRDLKVFFYWCMEESRAYIPKPFKIELIKGQDSIPTTFTRDEQMILIERPARGAVSGEIRTWAIVNWCLATGNRASTICNVRISDVSFSDGLITLSHTKNKNAQTIPLSSQLENVIKEYIRMLRSNAMPNDWLFPNVGENKLTTNALRLSFSRYVQQRGIENKTSIHSLRHTFAKEFILNNGNVFALKNILGHSSIAMTQRYVNLFGNDLKQRFDDYNPLDNLKKGASRKNNLKSK